MTAGGRSGGSSSRVEATAISLAGIGDEDTACKAYDALGVRLRDELLRFLVSQPEVSTARIMSEFGISRSGAVKHLRILSESGLVTKRRSTHPRGSGPITYWQADPAEVVVLMEGFLHYILGGAH